ncbi:MAG: hypothetical protein ACKOXB_13655 [Flavobacteriales bacterium]
MKTTYKARSVLTLCLLLCNLCFAQEDIKRFSADYNEDGTIDELTVNYFLGTLDFALYTDGATKAQYKFPFQRLETKHSLVKVTPIPYYFFSPAGEKALPKIDSLIYPTPLTKKADQSLLWLLDNYVTKTKTDNKYFSSNSIFQPAWTKTKPELPRNYRILINDTLLLKGLYSAQQFKDTSSSAYVTYLGKYHSDAISLNKNDINALYPMLVDTTPGFKMYQSAHGIYIKQDSLYSWVFVCDGGLYNNIQKVEWESIIGVETYNDYVIVLNQPYPAINNSLFIVDWKKGRVVELNRKFLLSAFPNVRYMESIQVTENYLYIFAKNKPSSEDLHEIKIDLREVITEMNKL